MSTPLHAHRLTERVTSSCAEDRDELDRILASELVCTVSTVVDGYPWALPMLYAKWGDYLVIHGSTGAGLLRHLVTGAPAVATVFGLRGLVFADSLFNSSANYDSAVVTGRFHRLTAEPEREALFALTERVMPGRLAELPEPTKAEWAATQVLALPITDENWTTKTRSGGAGSTETTATAWRGELPVRSVWGPPIADSGCLSDSGLPAAVATYRGTS